MKIKAQVNLVKNQTGDLKAMANITIDGCFVVNDLCVRSGAKGLYVTFPAKKLTKEYNGKLWKDIAHPITAECRKQLIETILSEYEKKANAETDNYEPKKSEKSEQNEVDAENIPF